MIPTKNLVTYKGANGLTSSAVYDRHTTGATSRSSTVITVCEAADSGGASLTNTMAEAATAILNEMQIAPSRVIWVQVTPASLYGDPETVYDLTTFDWQAVEFWQELKQGAGRWQASSPDWQRIKGQTLADLLHIDLAPAGKYAEVTKMIDQIRSDISE